MNTESPENIQSPEARKADRLFRKEEKVRESASAWTDYNRQKSGALQQLKRLREERLARGPVAPIVKTRAKRKSKQTAPPKGVPSQSCGAIKRLNWLRKALDDKPTLRKLKPTWPP